MTAANLKRAPHDVAPAPCIGCGKTPSIVVAFKEGARICEPCATKTLGIFNANREAQREAAVRRKLLGIRTVKGGPLRGAKASRATRGTP